MGLMRWSYVSILMLSIVLFTILQSTSVSATACTNNGDCYSCPPFQSCDIVEPYCNTVTNQCVDCNADIDCKKFPDNKNRNEYPDGATCQSNICRECTSTEDTPSCYTLYPSTDTSASNYCAQDIFCDGRFCNYDKCDFERESKTGFCGDVVIPEVSQCRPPDISGSAIEYTSCSCEGAATGGSYCDYNEALPYPRCKDCGFWSKITNVCTYTLQYTACPGDEAQSDDTIYDEPQGKSCGTNSYCDGAGNCVNCDTDIDKFNGTWSFCSTSGQVCVQTGSSPAYAGLGVSMNSIADNRVYTSSGGACPAKGSNSDNYYTDPETFCTARVYYSNTAPKQWKPCFTGSNKWSCPVCRDGPYPAADCNDVNAASNPGKLEGRQRVPPTAIQQTPIITISQVACPVRSTQTTTQAYNNTATNCYIPVFKEGTTYYPCLDPATKSSWSCQQFDPAPLCQDNLDNNCNNEADYDGGTIVPAKHGDVNCPVSVTAAAAPVSACNSAGSPQFVTVSCTASVANVKSIKATLSGASCSFIGWTGLAASFSCPTPVTNGPATVSCIVDGSISYVTGSSKTTIVTIQTCLGCSGYTTNGACLADASCRWDDTCSGVLSNLSAVPNGWCRDKTSNPSGYSCHAGLCGALCTVNADCINNKVCDQNTCGCVCLSNVETCGNGVDDNCNGVDDEGCPCDDSSACTINDVINASGSCVGVSIADMDVDGYNRTDLDCANPLDCNDNDALIHPGAALICGNGVSEDCSGNDPSCSLLWNGKLFDGTDGQTISVVGSVRIDNGPYFTVYGGSFSVPVTPGTHVVHANASGYDPSTLNNVIFSTDPTVQDVTLWPYQCQADCSFGGVCDYNCIGVNGCAWDSSVTLDERPLVQNICAYAVPGSQRSFNSSDVVNCCRGPIDPLSMYQTKLSIDGCSKNLIFHKTLVNIQGKIYSLTVATYKRCE